MFRIAFIGALTLGCANCTFTEAPKTDASPQSSATQNAEPSPQGAKSRYQIVISPHNARDTFLLDTETGRVWQPTVFTFLNNEPTVWKIMPRIDDDDDYDKVVNDYGRKQK
jgi:hypothetical protein